MERAAPEGIHRRSEVSRLAAALDRDAAGLTIVGVSGPGGVGKSFLLEHVLGGADLEARRILRLVADAASPELRGDFFGLIEGQLCRRSLLAPADPGRDHFPRVRRVAAQHREIVERAAAELSARGAPEVTKRAALSLLRGAHFLNTHLPRSRAWVDVGGMNLAPEAVGTEVDAAWAALGKLDVLRPATPWPGPLRALAGAAQKDRIKRELFNVAAEALVGDLAGTLAPARRSIGRRADPVARRLLLVLDDYEALSPVLGDFLVGALVPRLADAAFPSLLVISGRDDLEATHPGWAQHAKRHLAEQIRLRPFGREDAMEMLAEGGVAEDRREKLWQLSEGFPFLLALAIEEEGFEGAGSALFLRKFFERTTRWMAPREREWFSRACYLEVVNEDTLARLFPAEEVSAIQDWFEREASIRDPSAQLFRVRPLIRDKVLRYLELRSPSRHRELVERAAGH
jgi:hypothetical protein